MRKKIILRLVFVVLVLGICAYFVANFRQYIKTSTDPIACLTGEVDGLILINNQSAFQNFLVQDGLPLKDDISADWNLWMKWDKENEKVHELLSGAGVYWVHFKNQKWYLFLPIPDKWGQDDLESILSAIPNLMQWEDCLVWSDSPFNLDGWQIADDDQLAKWESLKNKSDRNASFVFLESREGIEIVLDYNNGNWLGFVNDQKWMAELLPLQGIDSLMGAACNTYWMAGSPERFKADAEMKKRVFPLDTMIQGDMIENWVSWQNEQWKYQSYDGEHWVASQRYIENPLQILRPVLKDTNSNVIRVLHPEWMPNLNAKGITIVTKYMSKRKDRIFIADDSLSILAAIRDTSLLLWTSDFSGYSDRRFLIYSGKLDKMPLLRQSMISSLVVSDKNEVVVIKNNEDWMLRVVPLTK